MNYEEQKQKRIEELVKKKEIRFSRTELNIEISWSINCAVASLSDTEKEKSWRKKIGLIKKRYPDFIEIKRDYLLENMPLPENAKVTRQDFVKAIKEAPARQAEQERAEEVGGEKIAEENEREANVASDLAEEVMSPKDVNPNY